jgi:hypothetical protein
MEHELIEATRTDLAPAPKASNPMDLMAVALKSGASMEMIERMWALHVQHEANEARKAYNDAFAAFKTEAVNVLKNAAFAAGPLNGKKYADLHDVVAAVTPALSKHGLGASWKLTRDEKDWIEVTCTLKHSGGHSESVSMGGPPDTGGAKNVIQARASTVSYLERYTLKAICGVAEQGQDDDGAGGASAHAVADCMARIDEATTAEELKAISRECDPVFTKARDIEGYKQFRSALAKRHAQLQ